MIRHILIILSVGALVACGGEVSEEPEAAPSYAEIAPVFYGGPSNECRRLSDELDGAVTKTLYTDDAFNSLMALAVCARISDSDEWIVVDGVLSVENITGEARVLPIPPPNASLYADAPASLEAVAVGHVRVTAVVGDMTGSFVIEIVEEYEE